MTNTILYLALIVIAVLFINSIKDKIDTTRIRESIWKRVLSRKRIIKFCERKGFDSAIDEDGLIMLKDQDSIHYFISSSYPDIIVLKTGAIQDEVDDETLKAAIDKFNDSPSPVKVMVKDDTLIFLANICCPVALNFYEAFDHSLSLFKKVEQTISGTYWNLKNEPVDPS